MVGRLKITLQGLQLVIQLLLERSSLGLKAGSLNTTFLEGKDGDRHLADLVLAPHAGHRDLMVSASQFLHDCRHRQDRLGNAAHDRKEGKDEGDDGRDREDSDQ